MALVHPSDEASASQDSQRMQPIAFQQVVIDDEFWAPCLRTIREVTQPFIYRLLQETGRIDALRLTWKPGDQPEPHIFWDSDVGKWIEAVSYRLMTHPDPALEERVDVVIDLIAQAQQPDGYLNTYFTAVAPNQRWTNLRDLHELYCAGHLLEGAVAYYQATGKATFLDVMTRYVDYIAQVFGKEPQQKLGYDGHEEIELALIKLYEATNTPRYLELSRYFVDERGQQPHYFDSEAQARGEDPQAFNQGTYEYNHSHLPIIEQTQVVGHAVRAMYLYSALADLARIQGDENLFALCQRLWRHLTTTRMYISGGIGTASHNEGFTTDYDLPNETAYTETCAAIGLVFWAHRMLQLDCTREYSDVMERALYNRVLSGVSLEGTHFFYDEPLASDGSRHRQQWFDVSCCPINVARLLPTLGQYIYSANATDIAVHLFIQSETTLIVNDQQVTLRQKTRYPWEGTVELHINAHQAFTSTIRMRIPGWCRDAQLSINGEAVTLSDNVQKGYVTLAREWQPGDIITLDLALPVERVFAHPAVQADTNRVALQRGPMLYCLEAVDNQAPPEQLTIPDGAQIRPVFASDILEGVVLLHGTALVSDASAWGENTPLYSGNRPSPKALPFTAIPYYAWDNRQPGTMAVWIHASP